MSSMVTGCDNRELRPQIGDDRPASRASAHRRALSSTAGSVPRFSSNRASASASVFPAAMIDGSIGLSAGVAAIASALVLDLGEGLGELGIGRRRRPSPPRRSFRRGAPSPPRSPSSFASWSVGTKSSIQRTPATPGSGGELRRELRRCVEIRRHHVQRIGRGVGIAREIAIGLHRLGVRVLQVERIGVDLHAERIVGGDSRRQHRKHQDDAVVSWRSSRRCRW